MPPVPGVDRDPLEHDGAPQAVAIVAGRGTTELAFLPAGSAVPGGLAGGAAAGAQIAGAALWAGGPLIGPAALLAILAAGAAGGALAGAIGGSVVDIAAARSDVAAEAARRLAMHTVGESQPTEALAAMVSDVARATTPYRIELASDPTAPDASGVDHGALAARGFAAFVEVRVVSVGFADARRSGALAMFVVAEASLVDARTGKPAWLRGLVHVSPARPPDAWADNGADAAMREYSKAQRVLAERVVDDMLLHAEAVLGLPDSGAGELSRPRACGLLPVTPKPALAWEPPTGDAGADAAVSTSPRLAWRPLPVAERAYAGLVPERARDRRYDLRIWSDVDGEPGELIYERLGLLQPEHVVEVALSPSSTYYWSVRLRYTDGGRPRATRWSALNIHPGFVPAALRPRLYHARIENGTAVPLACGPGDLYPCACLDDVPPRDLHTFRTGLR